MAVQKISAVTFAVRDMARSVAFYRRLGFQLKFGGPDARFTTLQSGDAYVNLAVDAGYGPRWWGRVVFRLDDVDAYHRSLVESGLKPEAPCDASWGERYFRLADPDGHDLSFAQPISSELR